MTKSYQKLIKSLHQKKYRQAENLFLVEGTKNVCEVLQSNFTCKAIFYTTLFYEIYHKQLAQIPVYQALVTQELLEQHGTLQSNDGAIAVVEIPVVSRKFIVQDYALALDNIRDPGNLGSMIRIADWYGIKQVLCSQTTVDWYNPKVISASMGSFLRVQPHYCDLTDYLATSEVAHYGMFLEGNNLHTTQFATKGIIIVGNESNGISVEVSKFITEKITIQRFGGAESLNAAMATAIVCDNLRRFLGGY